MSHLAAIIPGAKAALQVQEVETPQPGEQELLIKNELIGLVPIDAKIAKLGLLPVNYPTILGNSFGGTVVAVGSGVNRFKVGDRVVSSKIFGTVGDQYGVFQRYVVTHQTTTSKIPDTIDLEAPVSSIGNLATVVGLFNASAGLEQPVLEGQATKKNKKILVYGGSSSFGSLSVQYVAKAGYQVITTTSPKHRDFVSKLGATKVVDHTQDDSVIEQQLIAEGPYDVVVDSISVPQTINITAAVLNAQGGGKLYALQPAFAPERIPEGVTRQFDSWSRFLFEEKNAGLLNWTFESFFPRFVADEKSFALPTQLVPGGLGQLNEALNKLLQGVSGVKLVVNPWE
ncbi:alcohol dehydrogenase GroES-like domain-containing protein [Corynespora cassiicola Philippines]|uniref:Alcohol dehydrogenase GroES-like domain-containing protein n=1 Tax=Corynespora cassiicola Philippines TaxID=1448308 RepID=A0A2T2P746_CORCC|nr:alcohol dehydrogenase GroES-like domain-containing protein [Corynespora cassiicola Philippines]